MSRVWLLSHFHSDHMKGLHAGWDGGTIIASHVTKALLQHKFGDVLARRVVALPFWQRTVLLLQQPAHAPLASSAITTASTTSDGSDSAAVFVTLLPAFHITGSAMFFFETPLGNLLYTGDFRYEAEEEMEEDRRKRPHGARDGVNDDGEDTTHRTPSVPGAHTLLRLFFASRRVDHVFLDDTWLHLGVSREVEDWQRPMTYDSRHAPCTSTGLSSSTSSSWNVNTPYNDHSGTRVVSKLLDAGQLREAIEAVGRRMDGQRRLFTREQTKAREPSVNADTSPLMHQSGTSEHVNTSAPRASSAPFYVRVYLHNQYGKELLVQRLAQRLRTRVLLDDERYSRLAVVAAALNTERDELQRAKSTTSAVEKTARDDTNIDPATLWQRSGGEAARYPLDLRYFVSFSTHRTQLRQSTEPPQREDDNDTPRGCTEVAHRVRGTTRSEAEPPLIEVVGSRAEISPTALQAASCEAGGTPFYGIIMSGWARLQSQESDTVWHIPTTLHCTPQEIIDFVRLLRPASATPLHPRPSRSDLFLQRLGPHLRIPFANQSLAVLPLPPSSSSVAALTSDGLLPSTMPSVVVDGWFCVVPSEADSVQEPHRSCQLSASMPSTVLRGDRESREERSSASYTTAAAAAAAVSCGTLRPVSSRCGFRIGRDEDSDGFYVSSLPVPTDAAGTRRIAAATTSFSDSRDVRRRGKDDSAPLSARDATACVDASPLLPYGRLEALCTHFLRETKNTTSDTPDTGRKRQREGMASSITHATAVLREEGPELREASRDGRPASHVVDDSVSCAFSAEGGGAQCSLAALADEVCRL